MPTNGVKLVQDGDDVMLEVPPQIAYATLPIRVYAESREAADKLLSRLAAVVTDYVAQQAALQLVSDPHEAVFALKSNLEQLLGELGMRIDQHTREVDMVAFGDHLRRGGAAERGIEQAALLDWDQLGEAEQRGWLTQAGLALRFVNWVDGHGDEAPYGRD